MYHWRCTVMCCGCKTIQFVPSLSNLSSTTLNCIFLNTFTLTCVHSLAPNPSPLFLDLHVPIHTMHGSKPSGVRLPLAMISLSMIPIDLYSKKYFLSAWHTFLGHFPLGKERNHQNILKLINHCTITGKERYQINFSHNRLSYYFHKM